MTDAGMADAFIQQQIQRAYDRGRLDGDEETAAALRNLRSRTIEECVRIAEQCEILESPGPLFNSGWRAARDAIAGAISGLIATEG